MVKEKSSVLLIDGLERFFGPDGYVPSLVLPAHEELIADVL